MIVNRKTAEVEKERLVRGCARPSILGCLTVNVHNYFVTRRSHSLLESRRPETDETIESKTENGFCQFEEMS